MNLTLNIELTAREIACIKYFNTQTLLGWGILTILINENGNSIQINDFDHKEIASLRIKGLISIIDYLDCEYCLYLTELGLQCYERLKNEM